MSRRKPHVGYVGAEVTLCKRPVRRDRPNGGALRDPKAELCKRCSRLALKGGGWLARTFDDGQWRMLRDPTVTTSSSSVTVNAIVTRFGPSTPKGQK